MTQLDEQRKHGVGLNGDDLDKTVFAATGVAHAYHSPSRIASTSMMMSMFGLTTTPLLGRSLFQLTPKS